MQIQGGMLNLSPDQHCWCADIHTLLADIGMEQESFESAMTDHKRALELLSSILQVNLKSPIGSVALVHQEQPCLQGRRQPWSISNLPRSVPFSTLYPLI